MARYVGASIRRAFSSAYLDAIPLAASPIAQMDHGEGMELTSGGTQGYMLHYLSYMANCQDITAVCSLDVDFVEILCEMQRPKL